MKKILRIQLVFAIVAVLLLSSCLTVMAGSSDIEDSYCNPLNLPNMHGGSDGKKAKFKDKKEPELSGAGARKLLEKENWAEDEGRLMQIFGKGEKLNEAGHRGAGDPFVLQISDGTYVMHVSGICWTSTDLIHWEPHELNVSVGAPTFLELNGKYYLCGNSSDVYVSDCPWGPFESLGKFKKLDGSEKGFGDVNFFLDDDGRLYLSFSIGSPIYACELDPNDPTVLLTEPVIIWRNDGRNWWERFGTGLYNSVEAYTEGSQIFKYNGVYYLQVASGGTENLSYNISVKKSTEGPLSGYTYQQNNPVSIALDNFVPGAGHGCFMVDDDNNLVLFYTQVAGVGGRRVGMDVCWIDENGDINVNITDTPQISPLLVTDPANAGGDLKLNRFCTIGGNYWVSSYKEGRSPIYAMDDSSLTWWEPAEDDEEPLFHAPLMSIADIYAVQLNWMELGKYSTENAVQYVLEYFDIFTDEWTVIKDASDNTIPGPVDYITIPDGVRTIALRLRLLGTTEGCRVGVTDFRIFGENYTMAAEHNRWADYGPALGE